MTASGVLEALARAAGEALAPLADRLRDHPEEVLEELGMRLPEGMLGSGSPAAALQSAVAACGQLPAAVQALLAAIGGNDTGALITAALRLAERIGQATAAFLQVGTALDAAITGTAGLTPAQKTRLKNIAAAIPERLLHRALISWFEDHLPQVKNALSIAGLIDDSTVSADPADTSAPAFSQKRLRLDRLGPLLSDPAAHLASLYGFGTPGFDGLELFRRIKAALDKPDAETILIQAPGQPAALDAFILRLAVEPGATPALRLRVRQAAQKDLSADVPFGGPWSATFSSTARFEGGLEFRLHPQSGFRIEPPAAAAAATLSAGIKAEDAGGAPMIVIGQAGKSRIELKRFAFSVPVQLNAAIGTASPEVKPGASLQLSEGKIAIDTSESDGFIRTVLGGVKVESAFDLGANYATDTGLRFTGSATFEIAIPSHISLGPIAIDNVYLIGGFQDGAIPVEFSADIGAGLGPLNASVSRLGAKARLSFPPRGGNAGPMQVDMSFKPPTGVGLSLNAGPVRGGGFLSIDAERGEYAGALELTFAEFLSLKAVGIITTRMPDGSPGFSLLVIITAEFGSGLQLGFGFTLLGVGGIIGLNRVVNADALLAGIRSGAVNNIMFPRDVIANAPRIISDLRAIFPPRSGVFLIGPMAKLGWGTPTLVSISLGVIIEIPGNVTILGVLRVALPAEDAPIVLLQVSFVGRIEFDRKRLYFFASLFDSRVLFITLDGDLGLLAAFGEDANFVLSVGGFHPRFTAPPLPVPVPARISASILNESWGRIRAEGYFAVTSNTAQFGSRVEIFFGFDALSVESSSSFDALLQFTPFRFVVEVSSHFSVKVFGMGVWGLSIRLLLEGPAPWHAKGRASISLLFFDIPVTFDETWGERRGETLPPVSVMPLLQAEFDKKENWRTSLPAGRTELVALRRFEPDEDHLVLHPTGTLRVLQKLAPLGIGISKLGNRKAVDAKKFTVTAAPGALAKRADAKERFAAAQFNDLTDAQRLATPAFENQDGGLELAPQGQGSFSATAIRRANRYELLTIDSQGEKERRKRFHALDALFVKRFHAGTAAALSQLSAQTQIQKNSFADKVVAKQEGFSVASSETNTAITGGLAFASEAVAREFLNGAVANDPSLAGRIHVVPSFELAA
jgi:hypothetical protein